MAHSKYQRPNPRTKYCGVYAIRHIATGDSYIGGSTDMTGRFTYHRFTLRRGTHKTIKLQERWSRDGEAAFEFVVVERCAPEELLEREDALIKSIGALNTVKSAITGTATGGPSEVKKRAAVKRWANPAYRKKREDWLRTRTPEGRFQPQGAVVAILEV